MSEYEPRPYQAEAIERLLEGWRTRQNRLAVVLPTGAGKTVVFANLIRQTLPDIHGRALVIAHRDELITQAAGKIRAVAPDLRVGIVKAELDQHQNADVIVASIQTLASPRRREAIENIGLVIVDECHHAAARTYVETLEHFGAYRGLPVAGFTATLTRRDGGLAEVWQDVVFRLDILDLIDQGHLCDVRGKRVVVGDLDLDSVKTNAGDLQDGQLGEALEASGAAGIVADAYKEHAADRCGVVFTPTVSSADVMTDALNAAGIPTATVWGSMPKDERTATLAKYQAGDLQVLSNCMVLTEGFDHPPASCAVIARPTKSPGLYVQMAGRVLRPSPGKTHALLLDVMGASTRHKLASIIDLTDRSIREPTEGQSLGEAAEEQERSGLMPADVAWEDVDLFHNSQVRWLKTNRGTWFVPTNGVFYFLEPGQLDAGDRRIPRRPARRRREPARILDDPHRSLRPPSSLLARSAKRRLAPQGTHLEATRPRAIPPHPRTGGLDRRRRLRRHRHPHRLARHRPAGATRPRRMNPQPPPRSHLMTTPTKATPTAATHALDLTYGERGPARCATCRTPLPAATVPVFELETPDGRPLCTPCAHRAHPPLATALGFLTAVTTAYAAGDTQRAGEAIRALADGMELWHEATGTPAPAPRPARPRTAPLRKHRRR
jgi:superfamily II DNA or RNA helicase